jgi:hypothetical protein
MKKRSLRAMRDIAHPDKTSSSGGRRTSAWKPAPSSLLRLPLEACVSPLIERCSPAGRSRSPHTRRPQSEWNCLYFASAPLRTAASSHLSSRRLTVSSHHGRTVHSRTSWYRKRYGDPAPAGCHDCQPGSAFNKPNASMPALSSPFHHIGHHCERPGIRRLRKFGQLLRIILKIA